MCVCVCACVCVCMARVYIYIFFILYHVTFQISQKLLNNQEDKLLPVQEITLALVPVGATGDATVVLVHVMTTR